jgi:nucleotidyltransferase-like protein
MKPALEDLFLGPLASPSISQGFRWEDSRRRVRVVFADVTVADSKRVMLLHEYGRLPVFYFPLEDVRMDLLEESEQHTHSPLKGEAPTGHCGSVTEWLSMRPGAIPIRCLKECRFKDTWPLLGSDGHLV